MSESVAGLAVRVLRLEADLRDQEGKIDKLSDKIDRFIMAAVVAAFSCAGAVILLAINLMVMREGG